jgi:SAM-dependent methyltransferase
MSQSSEHTLEIVSELLSNCLVTGYPLSTLQIIDVILESNKQNEKLLLAKATIAHRNGLHQELEALTSIILDINPTNVEARSMLSDVLLLQCESEGSKIQALDYILKNDLRDLHDRALIKNEDILQPQITNDEGYISNKILSLAEQLVSLKKLNPKYFELWMELYFNSLLFNVCKPTSSCAVDGNATAEAFRLFIKEKLVYPVLDIGCGSYDVPLYLKNADRKQLYGIDPAEPHIQPTFSFVRGFNEILPYKDEFFNTIINCTSLDHCLNLDVALQETSRVLKDSGHFLVLIGDVPSAKLMDMNATTAKSIDKFHLFHFNRNTFEESISHYFEIEEIKETPGLIYYDLVKK